MVQILKLGGGHRDAQYVVLDVAQGEEGKRGIDLLVVDRPNRRHHDEDDARDDSAALVPLARQQQMHENVDHEEHEQPDNADRRNAIADHLGENVGDDQRYRDDGRACGRPAS